MFTESRPTLARLATGLGLAVVLMVTGGCAFGQRTLLTPTPWPTPIVPVKQIYTVQRGTVADRFELDGQLVPVVWQTLRFPVPGQLAVLRVTEGVSVQQGEVLAELEMKGLLDQLAQAEVVLEQAQDQMRAQGTSLQYAIERAQISLQMEELKLEGLRRAQEVGQLLERTKAGKELELARLKLQRAQAAYDAVAWRPDIGASVQAMALQEATLDYQIAETRYKLQTMGDANTEIRLQEMRVELARLALQELQKGQDPALERNVTKAKMQIEALERQIEERRLRAPFAGQVVAVGVSMDQPVPGLGRRPEIGMNVPAFTPLLVVGKVEELEIVVRADSHRATELVIGQELTVTHSLAPGDVFQARVRSLPLKVVGAGVEAVSPQVIRIALPQEAPKVSIGDHVKIDVWAEIHSDTLYLPPEAIRRYGGRTFVVVQEEGRERRGDVAIGLENRTQVEVLSGLGDGDVVVGE